MAEREEAVALSERERGSDKHSCMKYTHTFHVNENTHGGARQNSMYIHVHVHDNSCKDIEVKVIIHVQSQNEGALDGPCASDVCFTNELHYVCVHCTHTQVHT